MSIFEFWLENDWVIKILGIALLVVLVMVLEKFYQYFVSFQRLKELRAMKNLKDIDSLKAGVMRQSLEDIASFEGSSETLFNANVGVKLDLYEQYMMRSVSFIGLVAVLAPMIGLIGTFIGVWHVFGGVGDSGLNDPAIIARGIKEVLIDTMAGLVVAVIAMVFYKMFEHISVKVVSLFEEKLYELIRDSHAQIS